jgi:hypothetical protein
MDDVPVVDDVDAFGKFQARSEVLLDQHDGLAGGCEIAADLYQVADDDRRELARDRTRAFGRAASAREEAIEVGEVADDAAAQKAHQQHEDDAEHELPGCAEIEGGLQKILQKQPGRPAGRTVSRVHRSRSA